MTTLTKPRSGMRVSVAEFLDLELPEPDDRLKMELDDGELYVMPRPRIAHQGAQSRLVQFFLNHYDALDDPPFEVYADVIIALPSELPRLFAPDLAVILRSNDAVVGERMIEGAPDIVAEILSSDRNRDLVRKRRVYAEAGIPEYWIFDDNNKTVLPLELRGGVYVERPILTVDDTLATPLLPGLSIPLADVFRHRSRPQSVQG